MDILPTKEAVVIKTFQRLLRSGMDYNVNSMYQEAGKKVYIRGISVKRIINKYYQGIITSQMHEYVNSLSCSHSSKIEQFSEKFCMCERESRLIIRYIKRNRS